MLETPELLSCYLCGCKVDTHTQTHIKELTNYTHESMMEIDDNYIILDILVIRVHVSCFSNIHLSIE